MELMIVISLVALLAGISFPGVVAGFDSIRMNSATDSLVSFLNGALNRAERRQQAIELIVLPEQNRLEMHSNEPGFSRELKMPEGITIEAVLPKHPDEPDNAPRRLMVLPGSTAPGLGIVIASTKGIRRVIRLDPMTGYPRVESGHK
jgi:type II secretory pathway pseudopilin PulG